MMEINRSIIAGLMGFHIIITLVLRVSRAKKVIRRKQHGTIKWEVVR